MYFIIAIQMFITSFLQTAFMSMASARQTKRIREVFFKNILRQPMTFFDRLDQGSLATSVMEYTTVIQEGLGEKLALGVQFVSSFIIGLAVALYYSWELALLVISFIPIVAIAIGIITAPLPKISENNTISLNKAGSITQESLGSIRTIFSLGIEGKELRRYSEQLLISEKLAISKWHIQGCTLGFVGLVMWSTYALGLWFGSYLISTDMLKYTECNYYLNPDDTLHVPVAHCTQGGDIMIAFFSILFGGLQLLQAIPCITSINNAQIELKKILNIINLQSNIDCFSNDGLTPDDCVGSITFSKVTFAYPMRSERNVYNSLSLSIAPGTTVAFVGPSGSGKSTAVALIERFYDPDVGSIELDGHNVRDLRLSWLRQQIGLVSQEPVLFTGTIFENVGYGKPNGDATREEVRTYSPTYSLTHSLTHSPTHSLTHSLR